jgi:F0F1-type ATP synthase membrane subunit b/b'
MMRSRYLFFCFLILIAFSKEVLVFNEEVLILFCFSVFIYLIINYGGDMIASELDSRNKKIKEELDLYKNLKATTLHHLVSYHQKQKLVNFELKQILDFSKNEVKPIEQHYENFVDSLVILNFEERLKRVVVSENKVDAAFQKQVFVDLRAYLINSYSVETNIKKRREISKNCIKQLQSCFFK